MLPYTFAKKQEDLYYNLPDLKSQVKTDYYTRQFPLLDVELIESKIVYYGMKELNKVVNIIQYHYNNSTKMFEIEGSPKYSDVYAAFETEINRMSAYLTMKSI